MYVAGEPSMSILQDQCVPTLFGWLQVVKPSRLKLALLVLLVLFDFSIFQAAAGDYEIAYAIDARGLKEARKSTECTYAYICRLTFERSQISILLGLVSNSKRHEFNVSIYDMVDGCCYFSDGDRFIKIDADKPLHRLSIFEGKQRIGNEWVMNKRIGELFLGFRNFTPALP